MLTVHCTKKLLDELKIDIDKKIISINDPIFSWHSHLFTFNRKKCVIVMNNKTRFNFVLVGLKKADLLKFDSLIVNEIKNNLLAEKIDEAVIDRYLQVCSVVIYKTSSDRSILSQINEMKRSIEYVFNKNKVDGVETDIYELNRWLNRFVMLKLPKLYSGETMRDELMELFSKE
ncbi:DUF6933 domain-containing protein [Clostridium sp. 19966]|uniref:DUF6933 domain-containing protein n=1 Tax=Clostridium sp. 19966 TaxID=2768166 RepID=UPI0028EF92FB|nr:hypothetical protein [Clostridium sp. 19966]